MKALLSKHPGGPETLVLEDIPEPIACPGQVLAASDGSMHSSRWSLLTQSLVARRPTLVRKGCQYCWYIWHMLYPGAGAFPGICSTLGIASSATWRHVTRTPRLGVGCKRWLQPCMLSMHPVVISGKT